MERLTTREQGCCIACFECKDGDDDCGCTEIDKCLHRLRDYENTGLTPEEIMDGKMLIGWIPVEEQLPEEKGLISDKVLIAQGVHDKQISFGWLRNGIWVTSDMAPFVRQELITHWMPLPDKPVN